MYSYSPPKMIWLAKNEAFGIVYAWLKSAVGNRWENSVHNSYFESFVVIDDHLKPIWGQKMQKVENNFFCDPTNNFWPLGGVESKFR